MSLPRLGCVVVTKKPQTPVALTHTSLIFTHALLALGSSLLSNGLGIQASSIL